MVRLIPFLFVAAASQFPIHSVNIEGNATLPADALVRASGLQTGAPATPADFEAACRRLMETGLIQSAAFRYKSSTGQAAPGYDVTLQISEFSETHEARLDFPGSEEQGLWEALRERDPLLTSRVPAADSAAAYYTRAIERYFASAGRSVEVIARTRVDPAGNVVLVFRPRSLPRIVSVRFEGVNGPMPEITKALIGEDYSELSFRELLDAHVRPHFEDTGRFKLAFTRIAAEPRAGDSVAVAVTIDPGPVYMLGNIEVACEGVPAQELLRSAALVPGDTANWTAINKGVARMQAALARRGFLDSSAQIERTTDDAARRLDLVISIQKGLPSVFGELAIQGLKSADEARARALWRLPSGAAMNADYVEEFLRAVAADDRLRRAGFRTVGRRLRPRAGTNVVDVTVTFE